MAMNPFLMQIMMASQAAAGQTPQGQTNTNVSNVVSGVPAALSGLTPINMANMMEKASNARLDSAEAQMAQIAGMMPPKKRGAMRPGESGLVGVGMLLASLAGADKAGIAQAAQGYMGARQQTADLDNENALNEYAAKRENARMMAEIEMNKAQRLMSKANEVKNTAAQARAERVALDKEQRVFANKAIEDARQFGFDLDLKIIDNIGKVGQFPSQFEGGVREWMLKKAALGDTTALARGEALIATFKQEWDWMNKHKKTAESAFNTIMDEQTSAATRARAVATLRGIPLSPDLKAMLDSKEFAAAEAEATEWERVQQSVTKENAKQIELWESQRLINIEDLRQLKVLFASKKEKLATEILKMKADIRKVDKEIELAAAGEAVDPDRLMTQVRLIRDGNDAKIAEKQKNMDKWGLSPEAKETLRLQLEELEAESARLTKLMNAIGEGMGLMKDGTYKPQGRGAAGMTPTQMLNKQREDALKAGKDPRLVEQRYQEELKKLNAGK